MAPGPSFQTATTLNSENLRQHFQALSIQPPPGIPSPFPVIPPIDTSVPPPPVIFSQTPSPIHPEVAPHTSIPPQPDVSCQVQIPMESPDIAPTDSKHPLCFTAAAQVFCMPSQFIYDEKALPEPKVVTRRYLDSLQKLSPEENSFCGQCHHTDIGISKLKSLWTQVLFLAAFHPLVFVRSKESLILLPTCGEVLFCLEMKFGLPESM